MLVYDDISIRMLHETLNFNYLSEWNKTKTKNKRQLKSYRVKRGRYNTS
jgi:hypothetical protein